MFKTILLCFLLLQSGIAARAVDTLLVEKTGKSIAVGKNMQVFEDTAGAFTINEIIKKDDKFKALKDEVPVFATRETYIWAKLIVKNRTTGNLWLDIRNPTTDTILFFEKSVSGLVSKISGDKVPMSSRDIKSNRILFKIGAAREPLTIYLRFNIRLPRQFPIYIITSDEFYENGNLSFFMEGLFYGLLGVIVVYNLFLWMLIRDRSYLFYTIYIFFCGLLLMHFDGITYAYLWPGHPQINDHPAILASLPMFFAALFVSKFLNLRHNYPILLKGLWAFAALWTICCILSISGYKFFALTLSQTVAFIACIYFFLIGILIYRKGYIPARYYLAGWTFLIIGVLIFLFKDMGWVSYNSFTSQSLKIGTAAEAVLMAFALADRINFYKTEKNRLETEKHFEHSERMRVEDELKAAEILLTNYTENLKLKNNLIEKFKTDMEQLELKLKGSDLQKDQSEQIEKLLQSIILTEDDWIEFRKIFDRVHRGYIYRIKEKYSNLTETDVRLLTLMKLQLSQREMASMLGVTIEAVRKARQRMRKKLDLQDNSLEELISLF